jgi:hypothetical protein
VSRILSFNRQRVSRKRPRHQRPKPITAVADGQLRERVLRPRRLPTACDGLRRLRGGKRALEFIRSNENGKGHRGIINYQFSMIKSQMKIHH